jgi:predicted component of type VI protein secretion system
MNLTLEVTSPQASALGQARRKAFGMEGGTIGRMDDNTWVLSESFVSGRHAIIHFLEGSFQLEDTSRNGTFLNAERMVRGQLYPINSGDRITIEPYEIVAHVDDSSGPAIHSS